MAATLPNPLLSGGRTPDSSLSVQLHPLVLLTISDYITRHTLRNQQGPILGAIIGQQNGREVSMEHAFECKLKAGDAVNGQERIVMDEEWFAARLEQFKDVHKAPALDLVALFTLGPLSGPLPQHVPVLQQLQHLYNDSLILLLFHPETILNGSLTGGKLPISLYESYYEPGTEDADKGLQFDSSGTGRQLQMRFKELAFEVDSGEAEMIGVDFVAKGGNNATAITQKTTDESSGSSKAKGKANADQHQPNGTTTDAPLSAEDEELIASLTGKANAIKMLHQRITLIKSYLASLPPSYLTDASLPVTIDTSTTAAPPNQPLLRNISSMLSRLPLLAPASAPVTTLTHSSAASVPTSALATAAAQEHSDVHLVSLLSSLTRTLADTREFGSKYTVWHNAHTDKQKNAMRPNVHSKFGAGIGSDDWPPENVASDSFMGL